MNKLKTSFFCQSCGHMSPKWLGKCPNCNSWNTFVEEKISITKKGTEIRVGHETSSPIAITEIPLQQENRMVTSNQEFNRVLGGGIVPGVVALIGGEPGIGKSTLMLQLALQLKETVLYVSGEESEQQIKLRAERLGKIHANCLILTEVNTQRIFKHIENVRPSVLIIDSIQTLHSDFIESAAGSISQVRECAAELIKYAKETNTPVFLVGHITKEGMLAGPKVLEHMVDTVLQFEGDRHLSYRILRTIKNRFGSTSELGIYEMTAQGLKEVTNPSEILLSQREEPMSGVAIGASLEGTRPLLIEVQSLVSPTSYGMPQRSPTGFDAKRLNMLLAVLEKRGDYKLHMRDVFLNITGGLKIEDPALDLAVCLSIISSYKNIPISPMVCFAGEVGLGGEIRAIHRIGNRIAEAEKLGFNEIFISTYNKKSIHDTKWKIKIHFVPKIEDLIEQLF